jgi:hypothetical protein
MKYHGITFILGIRILMVKCLQIILDQSSIIFKVA